MLQAIRNHIIFRFIEKVSANGQFSRNTDWGLTIAGHFDDSAKSPRWAEIVSLGPECGDELRGEGCLILIEPLRWTAGIDFQGQKFWKTDENQVLGYMQAS